MLTAKNLLTLDSDHTCFTY